MQIFKKSQTNGMQKQNECSERKMAKCGLGILLRIRNFIGEHRSYDINSQRYNRHIYFSYILETSRGSKLIQVS